MTLNVKLKEMEIDLSLNISYFKSNINSENRWNSRTCLEETGRESKLHDMWKGNTTKFM